MSAPIIKTTLIFCPFNTSLIKDSCGLRNLLWDLDRLLLGYHPDLVLCAACDTLPMAVNLQQWHIHCDERCSLCGCIGDVATTAFMFCFGWLFACLVTRLLYIGTITFYIVWLYRYASQWVSPRNHSLIAYCYALLTILTLCFYNETCNSASGITWANLPFGLHSFII